VARNSVKGTNIYDYFYGVPSPLVYGVIFTFIDLYVSIARDII